jgi:hypothetical protein
VFLQRSLVTRMPSCHDVWWLPRVPRPTRSCSSAELPRLPTNRRRLRIIPGRKSWPIQPWPAADVSRASAARTVSHAPAAGHDRGQRRVGAGRDGQDRRPPPAGMGPGLAATYPIMFDLSAVAPEAGRCQGGGRDRRADRERRRWLLGSARKQARPRR